MKLSPAYLDLARIKAAQEIATTVARGRNKVYLEADTLMMNLTSGLNSSLEKKTPADHEAERLAVLEKRKQQQSK